MRSVAIRWMMVAAVLGILATASAAPPTRPVPLTPSQYQALCQLEAQPHHAAVLDIQASYTSEHEATQAANLVANDIATAATQVGWLSTPLILLILAAPL
ncbi:MAG TPA: hypothetical protein VLM89_00170 [Phycisphaerae bacterium]|nr:hypothetical protein [Phycisphaerae bacterium]